MTVRLIACYAPPLVALAGALVAVVSDNGAPGALFLAVMAVAIVAHIRVRR